MPDSEHLLDPIRSIHEKVQSTVLSACESTALAELSGVVEDGEGDTIYAIDRISETALVDLFETEIAFHVPIVLIAEGLAGGKITLPRGTRENDAVWRIIADPVDGTRPLMYQKRSAWILTGVAPNCGEATTLADIELAVQTELPLIKQHLSDALWAMRGRGACGERFNRITNARTPFLPKPSTARNLDHGFGSVTRFFPGGRDVLASIDDEISVAANGSGKEGKAQLFEDQYPSTGGQLYELLIGHDRFQADLRPLLRPLLQERGLSPGLCCHPYDLCTELIAREAGVLITSALGAPLNSPLTVDADVAWVGYANTYIQSLVEPLLRAAMCRHRLLASEGRAKPQAF
jgi:hypothetical protein